MTQITPLKKPRQKPKTAFQRDEMSLILGVYGRLVMSGQAKDYAVGAHKDQAVFAIFRRHTENPNWTILKTPALSRMQGAYSVHGAQGQVLKRGRDLKQVLSVFETRKFEIIR
ncbi:MAG: DUF2794 domain-containing protein [Pseudomonadota bacterium]